jgi:hypothetical protein
MTLQQWVEHGWLRGEPSSANEIRDLFSVVTRSLKDAKVEAISDDLRFRAAFSAALNAAYIALRASGYRRECRRGITKRLSSR